ncbi:MAG: dual specificity protein phosphatase family protein, partial [Polyangiaceae bacterium]|nr:dual specificity protein phosphatase family protein [Polyangiaceae bacterium]
NLPHARAGGDAVALLAGGRVLEARPAADFFAGPSTEAGRHFLSSGSCSVPSPGTPAEDLAEGVEPTPVPLQATEPIRNARGPRGFRWMKRGRLAGTPRPGLIDDFEADLEALRSVGVTLLVTLETERLPDAALRAAGLRSLFFPVEDMRAPSIEAARAHCEEIARLEAAGEVIAVHCRAGLGRTGTMLAAQLVHEGASALEAIEAVRRVEAQWIKSEAQIVFLERFAEALRAVR